MALYQPKPHTIEAFRIVSVEVDPDLNVAIAVKLENGETKETPWSLVNIYSPQPGDFYLVKPDGYVQIKPKLEFHARYEPVAVGAGE